jgi:hypothetical protein
MKHVWRRAEGVQGFDGETEGKRPLARPRRRWEDNIKMWGYGVEQAGSG